jgi:hypothetical protein
MLDLRARDGHQGVGRLRVGFRHIDPRDDRIRVQSSQNLARLDVGLVSSQHFDGLALRLRKDGDGRIGPDRSGRGDCADNRASVYGGQLVLGLGGRFVMKKIDPGRQHGEDHGNRVEFEGSTGHGDHGAQETLSDVILGAAGARAPLEPNRIVGQFGSSNRRCIDASPGRERRNLDRPRSSARQAIRYLWPGRLHMEEHR